MVPRIASRGHSFKGAGMYYLHDRKADTSDRVAWTHTHNLPTNDPEKAMKWMAYTATHAEDLKRQSGVKNTGRRAEKGSVYSYSLAWHPDETPVQEHMREKALETLGILGLKDHEAVIIAHQETDHDHVHIVVNLVHPETGKTAKVYKDHLKLSEWAELYEREHGIYCEERIKNNILRNKEENKDKMIKYKEPKMERASLIQDLYSRSDSGKAFKAALREQGYTLASGNKGRAVIVDEKGDVFSLSRQLKGQRAKDIRQRLSDLDLQALTSAKELSEERKYFDRDKYNQELQDIIEEEAIKQAEEKKKQQEASKFKEKPESRSSKGFGIKSDESYINLAKTMIQTNRHRNLLKFDREQTSIHNLRKSEIEKTYQLSEQLSEIKNIEKEIENTKGLFSGKQKKQLEEALLQAKTHLEKSSALAQKKLKKLQEEFDSRRSEYIQKLDSVSPEQKAEELKLADEETIRNNQLIQEMKHREKQQKDIPPSQNLDYDPYH